MLDFLQPGLFLPAQGSTQTSLSVVAPGSPTTGSPLMVQALARFASPAPVLGHANPGAPPLLKVPSWARSPSTTLCNVRAGTPPFASDAPTSGLAVSIRAFPWSELSAVVLGTARLDLPSSAADFFHPGVPSFPHSPARAGFASAATNHCQPGLALVPRGAVHPDSATPVVGTSRPRFSLPALSDALLDPSMLSQLHARSGLVLPALDVLSVGLSMSTRQPAKLGAPVSVPEPAAVGSPLFLQSLNRLGSAAPVSGLVRCGPAFPPLDLTQSGAPAPPRSLSCPETASVAPGGPHFGSPPLLRSSARTGALSLVLDAVRSSSSSTLQACSHLGSPTVVPDMLLLDLPMLVQSHSSSGFAVLILDLASSGASAPVRTSLRCSSSVPPIGSTCCSSALPVPEYAVSGPTPSFRSFVRPDVTSPPLDAAQVGLVPPPRRLPHFGAPAPVMGSTRPGFLLLLLDPAPLGSSSLTRSFAFLGLSLPVLDHVAVSPSMPSRCMAWPGASVFTLDAIHLRSTSLSRNLARLGFAMSAPDHLHLGPSSLVRGIGWTGVPFSAFGAVKPSLALVLPDHVLLDLPFFARSFAYLGSAVPLLEMVNTEAPLLAKHLS